MFGYVVHYNQHSTLVDTSGEGGMGSSWLDLIAIHERLGIARGFEYVLGGPTRERYIQAWFFSLLHDV